MTTCQAIAVAALVSAASLHASSGRWIRFDAYPGSKITVRGTHSIHEWRAESPLVGGFLELESQFLSAQAHAPQLKRIEAHGEAFIPVRNLKSVGETWEPDNEQITVAMHGMIWVTASMRGLTPSTSSYSDLLNDIQAQYARLVQSRSSG